MRKIKDILAVIRNRRVFLRFFLSYSMFIVVPVMIMSSIIYVYIVGVIDQREEDATITEMNYFADSMDEYLVLLRNNMIQMLNSSSVDRQIRIEKRRVLDEYERVGLFGDISTKLTTLLSDYADKAFLFFPHSATVISWQGVFESDLFFQSQYVIENALDADRNSMLFSGQKMMELDYITIGRKTFPYDDLIESDDYISVLMSYPFHSQNPSAYLSVAISMDRLGDIIHSRHKPNRQAVIIESDGNIISNTGVESLDAKKILKVIANRMQGSSIIEVGQEKKHMSFVKSKSNQWLYISLIDLSVLRQPAQSVKQLTIWMVVFLVTGGIMISYVLSRRMYQPIRDIHEDLMKVNTRKKESPSSHNEFDLIKHYSSSLIYQNKTMLGRIDGMLPIVHEHFIGKVISGEISDQVAVQLYAEEIDLPFNPRGAMTVMSVEILFRAEMYDSMSQTDRSFIMIDLKTTIQKLLGKSAWVCQMNDYHLACIVQIEDFNGGARGAAESILNQAGSYTEYLRTVISIGCEVYTVMELKHSYTESLRYLESKSFTTEHEIVDHLRDPMLVESYLSREEMNRFINVLKANKTDLFLTEVHQLLQHILAQGATVMQMQELAHDILKTIYLVAEMEQHGEAVIDSYAENLEWVHRSQSIEELTTCFEDMTSKLVITLPSSMEDKRKLILEAADYIRNHCDEQLTLEFFAERAHMSLGNFSRSFKDFIGENYVDFVAKCRIEKAKELLLETESKVEDISTAVGYLGRNSFINTFKKLEGVTPGKYRKIHG